MPWKGGRACALLGCHAVGQECLVGGTLLQCGRVSDWLFPTVLPRVATGWAVPSLCPHLNMAGR